MKGTEEERKGAEYRLHKGGNRKMKKITIQIKDETAEALDKAAGSYYLRRYPIEQAYGMIMDDLVLVQKLPRCSLIPCCYVPPHSCIPGWWF